MGDDMSLLSRISSPSLVKSTLIAFVITLPELCWAAELGVALTPSHVLGIALMMLAGAAWWRWGSARLFDAATVPAVMLVVVALGTVVAVQLRPDALLYGESTHAKSLKQFIGLLYGVGLFFALTYLLRTYRFAGTMARVHHWTASVVAALTLGQFAIASYSLTSPLANFPVSNSTLGVVRPLSLLYGFPRVSLTMIEPSMLATYLISAWAMWLYGTQLSKGTADRSWSSLASGVLLGVGVVVSGSRLAYLVAATFAAGALVVRPQRAVRLALLVLTVALGASLTGYKQWVNVIATLIPKPTAATTVTAAPPGPGIGTTVPAASSSEAPVSKPAEMMEQTAQKVEQAAGTLDISVQQRAASYLVALDVFRQSPLFGTGWGTSAFYMEWLWPASFTPLDSRRTTPPIMLSHAATLLTETGLLGMACVLVFAVGVGMALWKSGQAGAESRDRAWGVAAAAGSYVMSSFAVGLVVYQFLLVWLIFALAISMDAPAAPADFADRTTVARR
jgi:hypothetical protein